MPFSSHDPCPIYQSPSTDRRLPVRNNVRSPSCIAIVSSTCPLTNLLTRDVAIWSTVEPGLGLCAAGGATLRPLFRKFYNLSTIRSRLTRNTHHRDSHMINLGHHYQNQHIGVINPSKLSSQSRSQSYSHSQIHTTSHSVSQSQSRFQFPFSSSASSSSPPDNESIYLRPDITDTNGVTTNIRSPFGDSRESIKDIHQSQSQSQNESHDRKMSSTSKMGGIKVQQTVEISRVENQGQDSDENSLRSEERPRTAKSSWDLV